MGVSMFCTACRQIHVDIDKWGVKSCGQTRLSWQVKEELQELERIRECGHSCGTCPTQHDCHLHEAVGIDMEDMFASTVSVK